MPHKKATFIRVLYRNSPIPYWLWLTRRLHVKFSLHEHSSFITIRIAIALRNSKTLTISFGETFAPPTPFRFAICQQGISEEGIPVTSLRPNLDASYDTKGVRRQYIFPDLPERRAWTNWSTRAKTKHCFTWISKVANNYTQDMKAEL